MMAGLPSEARSKVIDSSTDEQCKYNLDTAYREYYAIPTFRINPTVDTIAWNYSRCLDALKLSDIALMVDSLLKERQSG